MTTKLYDSPLSPNVRKVRFLAAELGVPLELVRLDFTKGDYHSPEYLAKNPNGKVPTIDDDGFVLWESTAILKYLAGKHPEKRLIPNDAQGQARLNQWLFWWTAHPESALYLLVIEQLVKPFLKKETEPGVVRTAMADVDRFLPVLDQQLAGRNFILGDLTIADFAVVPWLEAAPRLGVGLGGYANISSWLARMKARPSWTDTDTARHA